MGTEVRGKSQVSIVRIALAGLVAFIILTNISASAKTWQFQKTTYSGYPLPADNNRDRRQENIITLEINRRTDSDGGSKSIQKENEKEYQPKVDNEEKTEHVSTNVDILLNHQQTKLDKATERAKDPNVTKLILFWNEADRYSTKKLKNSCQHHNCKYTWDRNQIQEADMIIMTKQVLEDDWPKYRSPNQLYVHHLGERPGPWHDYIRSYNGKINLTMNYRKSADIVSHWSIIHRREIPLPPIKLKTPLANKTKMPHASIDAMDFKSPKDLADFLVSVGNNETAYMEYFKWKENYQYRGAGDVNCALCKAANIYDNKPAYDDYYDYWFSGCDNGYVDRLRLEGDW